MPVTKQAEGSFTHARHGMGAPSLRMMVVGANNGRVAGELEALILVGLPAGASQLLAGLPIADLAVEGARLMPITDASEPAVTGQRMTTIRSPGSAS